MGFSLGFRPGGTLQTLDLRSTCTVTDLVPKYHAAFPGTEARG